MKKHFLYCSICSKAQALFAEKLSEQYGYGRNDYAIVLSEIFQENIFDQQLDFRTIIAGATGYREYEKKLDIKRVIDDEFINKVIPYVMQSYNMLCRQYGYVTNITLLERNYLSGISFWKGFLEKYDINTVVFFTWPHEGNDYLLYQVCKVMEIPTIIQCFSMIPERSYFIRNIEDDIESVSEKYNELLQIYREKSIDEICVDEDYLRLYNKMVTKKEDKTPWYMKKSHMKKDKMAKYLGKYAGSYQVIVDNKNGGKLRDISLKDWIKAGVYGCFLVDFRLTKGVVFSTLLSLSNKNYIKNQLMWKHYNNISVEADFTKKYVYFPMHFQPECTSNPQGGIYYKQILPIQILSECLPEDYYIYVKEHPAQLYGAREKADYDEIQNISKVIFVKPETDTYELINNSVAVATLIGTAGWEAVFSQKPCLMFGYWSTQHMPGVYHIRTLSECKRAIGEIVEGQNKIELKNVKIYLKALSETEGKHLATNLEDVTQEEIEEQVQSNMGLIEKFL